MQRREVWKAKLLVTRETAVLRLQDSARASERTSTDVCVCVRACTSVSSSLCACRQERKKKKTFLSLIYKLREEKRLFRRAHERGGPPLLLRVKMYERTERPNAQGQRRKLFKKRQISVRMQGLLWCCAAACAPVCPSCRRLHALSSASTILFITTCASVKKKKMEDTMNH